MMLSLCKTKNLKEVLLAQKHMSCKWNQSSRARKHFFYFKSVKEFKLNDDYKIGKS